MGTHDTCVTSKQHRQDSVSQPRECHGSKQGRDLRTLVGNIQTIMAQNRAEARAQQLATIPSLGLNAAVQTGHVQGPARPGTPGLQINANHHPCVRSAPPCASPSMCDAKEETSYRRLCKKIRMLDVATFDPSEGSDDEGDSCPRLEGPSQTQYKDLSHDRPPKSRALELDLRLKRSRRMRTNSANL
jgi:hypothetical protein